MCFLSAVRGDTDMSNNEITNCTIADLAPALSLGFHINYELLSSYFPPATRPQEISVKECEGV